LSLEGVSIGYVAKTDFQLKASALCDLYPI
jgi:hypothetical protein